MNGMLVWQIKDVVVIDRQIADGVEGDVPS
jgi:hypothetical protein